MKEEKPSLGHRGPDKYPLGMNEALGQSEAFLEFQECLSRVAPIDRPLLLIGERGTGKELAASRLHYLSKRWQGPLVALNCSALSPSLIESELFGYEKGAFTDAKKTHRGRFELADGGTLLLDEISEMPLNLQSKLLRVIQEREFERVGSAATISVDVRLIATSNRNLKEYIAGGKFRDDLFYRLNVIQINVPPLEERKEDIAALVQHFIDKYNHENSRHIKGIEPAALKTFLLYHWPGNVRELENLIERAVVTSKGEILTADDFPAELEDAATVDGCNDFKLFTKIVIPSLKPGLVVVIIWQFLTSWNEFFLALVTLNDKNLKTLTLIPMQYQGFYFSQPGCLFAILVIISIPMVVFYALVQKNFVKGLMTGAVKG